MSKYFTEKIVNLIDAGAIFASAIQTPNIQLDNYQSAKVSIKTGDGEEVKTTAKVIAILPDKSEVEVKTQEITIGKNIEAVINVVANEIAHYDATEFTIKIDEIKDCAITGSIIAVLGEPRYSE